MFNLFVLVDAISFSHFGFFYLIVKNFCFEVGDRVDMKKYRETAFCKAAPCSLSQFGSGSNGLFHVLFASFLQGYCGKRL